MDLLKDMEKLYAMIVANEFRSSSKDGSIGWGYSTLVYLSVIRSLGSCTITQLAQALHLSKSTVSLKVDSMETDGLLEKVRRADDRRKVSIRLTDAAENLGKGYNGPYNRAAKRVKEEFTEDECQTIHKYIRVLAEEME